MSALLAGGVWQLLGWLVAGLAVLGGWVLKLRADARASRAEGVAAAERGRAQAAEALTASARARADAQAVAAGKSDEELDATIEAMARAARGEPPAERKP